jgi:predicted transposase YdaD
VIETAKKDGEAKGKNEAALKMLEDGVSIENICKYTSLSEEQVKELIKTPTINTDR